jgi:beta-1,2-mannobiose phosphorylase / 1,2-beta-oligomannan phosphorylase
MVTARRFPGNPILSPDSNTPWEHEAVFNGCPVQCDDGYHMLYRAQSLPTNIGSIKLELSTIGHAISFDRIKFLNRRQFIFPEYEWERYGCEDPRITFFHNSYYIFYTAIGTWPPAPEGIKAACAITHDFRTIDKKFLVTPFNAKAMTLFPEKINEKIAILLTANPDIPPSTIGVAYLDHEEDLINEEFWNQWYTTLPSHAVPLLRSTHDHVEIGAPPIKTKKGWLLIYCYIKSYLTSHKFFGIEAALLDIHNPQHIIGRTSHPILFPETDYEREGKIPNVIFPSGALVFNDTLGIYYGGADTHICLATCNIDELLSSM